MPLRGFQRRPDRRDGLACLGGIRATGLSHIGPAAAALPAESRGRYAHEIDRAEAARQIIGDADHDARLVVFARTDEDHDARAE